VVTLLAALPLTNANAGPPLPEPNTIVTILPEPCAPDAGNQYEAELARREGWDPETGYVRYPGACQRLRFAFGPIAVKPGQNDVLIEPVLIDKPMQDGYITRVKPDLVRASDGQVPPIEQIHLHHGTWINASGDYGSGPFMAAGEEKTLFPLPRGYGMPVKASDQWLLLYMIHSAVASPDLVYITYDVDFIPKATGDSIGIKPAYPIWLDVRPSSYPVFNVQRGYGASGTTCTWPREECAGFDPYGKVIPGQGAPPSGAGTDWSFPPAGSTLGRMQNFQGGTLIGIGGHLHPGGLTNDIDLVRNGEARRIYTGESVYWDRNDSTQTGGPPTSWDFSMKIAGLPQWGVHVQPGDTLRSNATYDTTIQSTYENMGIAIAFIAPDTPDGSATATGIDAFAPGTAFDTSPGCDSGGLAASTPTLCDKGLPTHGHLHENDNFGGAEGGISAQRGAPTDRVNIGGFLYAPGDLSMISMTGIPTVKPGQAVTFSNLDSGIDVYHSVTSCAYPCTGPTGTSFPLATGQTSLGRNVDFDSGQLGFGIPQITGAKNVLNWNLDLTGYQPGEIVTYYCRIHPFMRGALEVAP
jgi:plastocyanin